MVRELVGHGLGRDFMKTRRFLIMEARKRHQIKRGLVIAIEPMINLGRKEVYNDKDGWTIRTKDGKPSAHYEHTVCVRKDKADILSSFDAIEAAEKANGYFVRIINRLSIQIVLFIKRRIYRK